MADAATCAGCGREFEDGDLFIEDTSSGFTNRDPDPEVDGLVASFFGGADGKVMLCESCTERGGNYHPEVFHVGA